MLHDRDIGNHRLALTTLNSAIHNKMKILLPHLAELLPVVFGDTQIKNELIREVQMGPFKHKVDDGLELRKVSTPLIPHKHSHHPNTVQSAYETLYACVDTSYGRSHAPEFFDRIIAGIDDEHDIRTISNLMTTKFALIAPEETQRHLDQLSERYAAILAFKPKENAVKQELEKAQEASLGIIKVTRDLSKALPNAETSGDYHKWTGYMEGVRKNFGAQLKSLDADF